MAGGGGAWKVAYADFVTAMMALFLVLWLVSQETSVKEAIERAFRSDYVTTATGSSSLVRKDNVPVTSTGRTKSSDSALEQTVMRRVMEQLQSLNTQTDEASRPVSLNITAEGIEVNIFDRNKRPLFVEGSDQLTMYGRWIFSTLAWPITEDPEMRIELAGHTEAGYQSGLESYTSWELSSDRAKEARRALLRYGVRESQIRRMAGYGDTQPLSNKGPGDPDNRRVTVLLRLPTPMQQLSGNTD